MAFINFLGSTAAKLASQLRAYDLTTSDDFAYKPFTLTVTPLSGSYTYTTNYAKYFHRGSRVECHFAVSGVLTGVMGLYVNINLPVRASGEECVGMVRYYNGTFYGTSITSLPFKNGASMARLDGSAFTVGVCDLIGSITYIAAREK